MADLFGAPTKIKAISLWQPWASLMAAGVKRHETRHWATSYRGPIALHAAKTVDVAGAPDRLCLDVLGEFWAKTCARGAVVAVGQLIAVLQAERVADHLTPADLAAGNFTRGRFAWRVDNIRRLDDPIPTIGRQGLFDWSPPADIEQRLGPALDHGAAVRLFGWAA